MTGLVVIAVVVLVVAAALAVFSAARRRDTQAATGTLSRETLSRDAKRRKAEQADTAAPGLKGREIERAAIIARTGQAIVPASSTAPTVWVPPDPETYGVTRRQFLNRSIVGLMGFSIAAFAAASFTAFLWPSGKGGFGSKIRLGKLSDIKAEIEKNGNFLYKPDGRMWVVEYPSAALPKAEVAYKGQPILDGMKAGIVALYQKCPHLGCRVPSCATSQWFECPCHGSTYNRVGEKKGGPAPRGMDRFAVEVSGDIITVNTGLIVQGPPIGTNTTGQEAEGPHCITGGSGGH
ncbi:MAG: Rieske 2Fe-2S domain-containing protein [Microthrixaceae bacterium]|nr:Rieske 2Fe-2S domain-containing protein [Microthrixaceae bacterium]